MRMLDLEKSNLNFEHEGEMFSLGGELAGGFVAWKSWIKTLGIDGERIPISEQEQLRVMSIVMEFWSDDELPIFFINDDLSLICTTAKTR